MADDPQKSVPQNPGKRRGGESITPVQVNSNILLKIREKWKEEEHIWPAGEVSEKKQCSTHTNIAFVTYDLTF
jgi:hypothetical protein